jgi:hypothetical protein
MEALMPNSPPQFKPSHKEIKRYYEELAGYATHEIAHEGATSSAFQNLLAATCKKADWNLVPQLTTKIKGKSVRPDGTLRDEFNLQAIRTCLPSRARLQWLVATGAQEVASALRQWRGPKEMS